MLPTITVIVEQNLVGIDVVVSAVTLSPLGNTHDLPSSLQCENVLSSTKPEVHNVSQRHQRRTEPRRHATCKFGRAVSEICQRTNRQTDILMAILRNLPERGEVIKRLGGNQRGV